MAFVYSQWLGVLRYTCLTRTVMLGRALKYWHWVWKQHCIHHHVQEFLCVNYSVDYDDVISALASCVCEWFLCTKHSFLLIPVSLAPCPVSFLPLCVCPHTHTGPFIHKALCLLCYKINCCLSMGVALCNVNGNMLSLRTYVRTLHPCCQCILSLVTIKS